VTLLTHTPQLPDVAAAQTYSAKRANSIAQTAESQDARRQLAEVKWGRYKYKISEMVKSPWIRQTMLQGAEGIADRPRI
jgi:hypothetical protein